MAGAVIGAVIGGGAFAAGSTFFGATLLASAFTGASLGNMWDQHQAAKEAERQRQESLKLSSLNTKTEDCPISIIYGTCRVGGNILYDSSAGSTKGVKDMVWCIGLGEGELADVREVKVNEDYLTSKHGCSYTAYLGTNAQPADSRNKDENYSNTAYLAVTLHASEDLTGSPIITSIVDGLKVKVWKNGAFVRQFSRNPVWCLYDIMTNKRYGCGIEEKRIDLDSFIECANYCDELVDDGTGTGTKEPRFVFDAVINDLQDADAVIAAIAATFRGFVVYSEGIYKIRLERAELPTQEFIEGESIISNSIAIGRSSRFETPNRVIVQFTDPVHWTTDQYTLDDDDDIRNRGLRDKTISFVGVKRRTQAARTANYIFDMLRLCPNFVEFKVPFDRIEAEPGDVVRITHSVGGYVNKLVRILTIELDDKYELKLMCREYNPEVYSDDPNKYQVTDESSFGTQLLIPPNIQNIVASEEGYMSADGVHVSDVVIKWDAMMYPELKYFEVSYMYEGDTGWTLSGVCQGNVFVIRNAKTNKRMKVKVVTVNDWNRKSSGVELYWFTLVGKDIPPSNVPILSAVIDTTDSTKVKLSWVAVDDIDLKGYRVMEGNTILTPNPISDTQYVCVATQSRQHNFSVVAVDNSGNISKVPATESIIVKIEPNQVAGFSAVVQEIDRSKLLLSWVANNEKDISYYEIREGTDWDTANVIAAQLKATTYTHSLTSEGYKTFLIKAVNIAGKHSVNASSCSLQVTLRPDAPTNLQAQQEPKDRSLLKISWTASPGKDIAGYEIRKGINWDTAEYVTFTRETTYWYSAQNSGSYNFMISSKIVAGYYSNAANVSIAATIEPYDVTGFTAVQNISDRTKVTLMWDNPISQDVSYFIIKKGVSWDAGTVIASRATGTFYDVIVPEESEQTFWIKAVSVAGKESQYAASTGGIFNMNPSPVSNIQITQQSNDKSIVIITWDGVSESDLVGYQVAIGYTWETAEKLPLTQELKTTYKPLSTGDMKVIIKTVNAAGYYSDEVFNHAYITLEPQDVTGFQVLQNGEYVEMYWDKATESDVVAYEIREGASFDQGSLVASGVTVTEYKVKVDTERQYYYHIKAINRSLHYSQNAAHAMVTVQNLPPKNVIETFDEIALQNGTHENTEFGQSLINWQTIGGKWSDYPNTKFSDVGGQTVLKLKQMPDGLYTSAFMPCVGLYYWYGIYISDRIDVGQVITANISADFRSTVVLRGAGTAKLQIRTSRDSTAWTDWQDFRPAQYTFRYADFQVLLGTTNIIETPEVNHMTINIDVPDTEKRGSVYVPVGGLTIPYGHNYYTVPVITPTAIGENVFVRITAKTKTDFNAKVVDRNETDVGGQIDYRIIGY